MRKICLIITILAVASLALSTLVRAQAPPGEPKTTPMMEETGEPEGDAFHFPATAVDQRVYQLGDPGLSNLARRIENGSANMIERRSWWWLEQRLLPFDKLPPSDWRLKTQAAIKEMERVRDEAAGPSPETTYTWAPIGAFLYPDYNNINVSGRATAIWVDPTNANTIILGTADGGVWKTTDKGTTWTAIFDSVANLSIGAIGVDPNNSQIIYVGTGESNNCSDMIGGAGIFKSTNGGSTWSSLTLPAWQYAGPFNGIKRIAVDPRNSSNVYAATDNALLYSTNAGTSWTRTFCNGSSGAIASDLVLDSTTNPTTIVVAFGTSWSRADNGVFRATSGAGPWTTIGYSTYGNGFPSANIGRITLLMAPSDQKQVYALIQNVSTSQSLGIFYTADVTATPVTWQAKSATNFCSLQCWYDMTGVVNPTDPTRLIVGGLDNYLSTDTGATLAQISQWNVGSSAYSHADHHHMVMPDATTVYDANDGGFFIGTINWGTPASTTWVNKNSGLNTLQFYGFAQHPTDSTKVQGGLQDNGQFYYNGASWKEVAGGDGGCSAWDQTNALYAYEEYVYAGIYRNSNMVASPTSWTCIRNFGGCANCSGSCVPDSRCAFIAPFALDANNQNTMYTGSYKFYKNSAPQTGSTWTAATTPTDFTGGSGYITAIHSAKNNGTSGYIYVGTSDGRIWLSIDGGANFTSKNTGLAAVTSFTTDPTNYQKVLATVSAYGTPHIYRSTDGGGTWTNITGALPAQPFNTIILDPADVNHAYAGSDFGVYENTAVWTGTTWTSLTYNLPAVSVQQLGYVSGGKLRAATHGRAIWEFTVSSSPNPKEDSPSHNMTAAKGSGTSVNVTFTNGCGATDNTVYSGSLATLQSGGISWTTRYCNKGITGSCTFDPGSTNIYFVIVGNNAGGIEGSYGQNSGSVERPAAGAGSPCAYTQNLTGACP